MTKKVKYHNLVGYDEVEELIKLGVQRAVNAKNISSENTLNSEEIEQVSGGVLYPVLPNVLIPIPFPWGIFPRDLPIGPALNVHIKY